MKIFLILLLSFVMIPVFATDSNDGNEKDLEASSAMHQSKIIEFKEHPASAIVDEKTNKVYVTGIFVKTLFVIDGYTDQIIDSFTVIPTPFGVGINPNTNLLYVGGEFVDILSVINVQTKEVEIDIPLTGPYEIAVNPTNNMIYVTSDKANTVSVIKGINQNFH